MAPDLPVRTRELTRDEADARLGSQLADGFVVVERGVAEAAKYGDQRMTRNRRRAEARAASARRS
jgi:hypothetical protein